KPGGFGRREKRDFAEEAPRESRLDRPEPPSRQPSIQSGLLTAGSLDDARNFEDYRQYLSETLQNDPREQMPRFSLGRRIEILVQNEQGRPVPNLIVSVRRSGADAKVLEVPVGTDGKAQLLTAWDSAEGTSKFDVTARTADGGEITRTFNLNQTPWTITLQGAEASPPTRLDLSLVIDATASMGDELNYLKAEIDGIAAEVRERFPNVTQRYSLICYRDEVDQYVTRTSDFTESLSEFRGDLAGQQARGGGDYTEAMHVALETATQLDWRRGVAARVMFLVADAPPHQRHAGRTLAAIQKLRQQGVTVFPIAGSGSQDRAEFILRAAAFVTRGQYLFLTDHSGVGNPHAAPRAPRYQVERLDRLMIRMIASELSGRKLLPKSVIATETQPSTRPIATRQQHVHAEPYAHPPQAEPYRSPPRSHSHHARHRWSFPKFPRWTVLVGALLCVCVIEFSSRKGWVRK
ncbi:MAG: VWA domain-containing protein, partial [Planctomycetales bacterium]